MPIKVQKDLPAKTIIENENIFIMDDERAITQDIRPLKILILNLMPLKEDTEIQLLRELSNTPLQVDTTFMHMATHVSKNTAASHLNKFYVTFEEVKNHKYDGMIITGAPVEQMDFEDVAYWEELVDIMEWTKTNVTSTLHICWGAQAGLYHHYGIEKILLPEKMFGIYRHKVVHRRVPIVRGFDDEFNAPHSRHTGVSTEEVHNHPELNVVAESSEAGVLIVMAQNGRQIYVLGHPEYDRMTLDQEYKRDIGKGLDIKIPRNYYPDDNPNNTPILTWRSVSNGLYTNWLNYYVYQETPYDLGE